MMACFLPEVYLKIRFLRAQRALSLSLACPECINCKSLLIKPSFKKGCDRRPREDKVSKCSRLQVMLTDLPHRRVFVDQVTYRQKGSVGDARVLSIICECLIQAPAEVTIKQARPHYCDRAAERADTLASTISDASIAMREGDTDEGYQVEVVSDVTAYAIVCHRENGYGYECCLTCGDSAVSKITSRIGMNHF